MEPLALLRKTYVGFSCHVWRRLYQVLTETEKRKFSFYFQNLVLQCGLAKKGVCSESLWTFSFLFGLLRFANCAWFCLSWFCRGINKG